MNKYLRDGMVLSFQNIEEPWQVIEIEKNKFILWTLDPEQACEITAEIVYAEEIGETIVCGNRRDFVVNSWSSIRDYFKSKL